MKIKTELLGDRYIFNDMKRNLKLATFKFIEIKDTTGVFQTIAFVHT